MIKCCGCSKEFNELMRNCPFCGARRSVQPDSAGQTCPVCRCGLEGITYKDEQVEMCPECEGMWVDMEDFDKLTSQRHVFADPDVPFQYRKTAMEQRQSYVPCPVCTKLMIRRNFRGISGVIIDICGDHGVWFDKGELEQIRSFVASGGIEQSQDRQITAQADTIDILKSRVSDLEMMEKILHKWDLKRWRFRKF